MKRDVEVKLSFIDESGETHEFRGRANDDGFVWIDQLPDWLDISPSLLKTIEEEKKKKTTSSEFEEIALGLASLLKEKESKYGDTYQLLPSILPIFYKNFYDQKTNCYLLSYDDFSRLLAVTRVFDKLCRIVHGDKGEESAWRDIAGYAMLEIRKQMKKKEK